MAEPMEVPEYEARAPYYWTTTELTYMVVFAAVFGLVGTINAFALGVFAAIPVLGTWLSSLLTGFFGTGAVLAMIIIQKPGTAALTIFLINTVEFLTGDPLGAMLFSIAVAEAIGMELAYAAWRYRNYGLYPAMVAGALHNVGEYVWVYFTYGYYALPWFLWLPQQILGTLAGPITCGLLPWSIAMALLKSGTLSGLRIARKKQT